MPYIIILYATVQNGVVMTSLLDRLLPAYDFRARYTRRIAAEPETVWTALHEVTAAELPTTRLLMLLRTGGRSRMTGPMIDISPMPELGRADGREEVRGMIARYWKPRPDYAPADTHDPERFAAFTEPGWAKAAMSFQLTPTAEGTELATETRIAATDPASRRAFGVYWLLIKAGSGLIRQEMLRAVARRAEANPRS